MRLVVEYLVIVEKNISPPFFHICHTAKGFNQFLQSTTCDLVITHNTLTYKDTLAVDYKITIGELSSKEQRFVHMTMTFNGDEDNIDAFTTLLKAIKTSIHSSNGQLETLWNDISGYYSRKSYPLIHAVENLMRKLIAYFMLTTIGKEWITETSPKTVKEAIDKSKRKQYVDVLHQIDFSHLGDFLFKCDETKNIAELLEKIETAHVLEDLTLDELKSFLSKSNWERYFSTIVDCDDSYLNKRWKQLYELRCMVAHNAIITKGDYEQIVQLASEIQEKLQKAIDNIDKVHVPQEEKEQIAENVASNINSLYGEFIQLWKSFQSTTANIIKQLNLSLGGPSETASLRILQNILRHEELIDDEMSYEMGVLIEFRNSLVHDANITISESEVSHRIDQLKKIREQLQALVSKNQSWKELVMSTLETLGREASLADIYEYLEKHAKRELPENWRAMVRYTLQLHSSDTKTFERGSGEDLFQRLDRGYWALRAES